MILGVPILKHFRVQGFCALQKMAEIYGAVPICLMLALLRMSTIYRKNFKYWDMYVLANSVDSDQTALKEQSDQDLHCLPFYLHVWRHYFIVKLNCFILRTTTVAGLGVPIFRVFAVFFKPHLPCNMKLLYRSSQNALQTPSSFVFKTNFIFKTN